MDARSLEDREPTMDEMWDRMMRIDKVIVALLDLSKKQPIMRDHMVGACAIIQQQTHPPKCVLSRLKKQNEEYIAGISEVEKAG